MSEFMIEGTRSPRAWLGRAFVAAGLLLSFGDAHALLGDRLELFASEGLTYDDNVFRISRNVDPQTAIGSSSRSDLYSTTSAGLNLNVPWSRQVFQGGWATHVTRFNRFDDLDFTGHDARAVWLWQVGNDLSGQLGHTESKALASFVNIQARLANPLTTKQNFLNAVYALGARWRLRGGVTDLTQRNGEVSRQISDVDIRTRDVGLAYITPAGTQLGVAAGREEGEFPNREFIAGDFIDNAYTQNSVGVFADWTPSGASHWNARVDRVRREFNELPQRDFNGTTFRVLYDWRYSPRFTTSTVVHRDIAALLQDIRSTFNLTTGVTVTPVYALTEKMTLTGMFDYSRRRNLGDPGFVLTDTPAREDRLWTTGVTLTYRALRTLTFLGSLQHESRTSNAQFADYQANIVSISARIGF